MAQQCRFQELIVYLETETQVEDTVEMTLIRDGQERCPEPVEGMKVSVTLAERPEQFCLCRNSGDGEETRTLRAGECR